MTDEDITAFRAPASAPPPTARSRRWPLALLALCALAVLVAGALGAWLVHLDGAGRLDDLAASGVTLSIDGDAVQLVTPHGASSWAAVLGALSAALVVLLLVVPLALLAALMAVVVVLAMALGVVLFVVAICCSPLLLPAAFLWWLLRPRPRAATP